ncbi:Fe-S cluster assembly protein SufD [Coralloluteibacterium stylophorae]|uniref:Fe-S cluster assembly protein SufD n=1 Tax=Coralloluteibacterium stylophorae TaxID=1776034 RepID=UPI00360F7A8B
MPPLLDSFRAEFDAAPPADLEGAHLRDARRYALAAALRDGLPGPRSEAWKYTSLRALERRSFVPAPQERVAVDPALLAEIPAPRLVFVNGHFDAGLSRIQRLPRGVHLIALSQALHDCDPRECAFMARRFDGTEELFPRVNSALAVDGVMLRATEESDGAEPVHVVFVGAPADGDRAWNLRHMVELREQARLTLCEHILTAGEHAHLANTVMQVKLAAGSRLDHVRIQDEGAGASLIQRTEAALAGDAVLRRLDLELGAGLGRHEFNVALRGADAAVHANGVQLAAGRRHNDTRLAVDHAVPDTRCELTWRGIGAERGRAVFHGGILIRAGADRTDANLSNKNLLLSEGAEVDSQPVLEIHADEVKAAHGTTVGQLDPQALFYLRARGVPAAQARAILTAAFCRETLAVIANEALRELATARLDAALERLPAP